MGERYPSGHHNRESRRSERSNSEIVGRRGPEEARCTPPWGAGRHGRRGSRSALLAAVALVLAAALHLATGASWASAAAGTVNAGDLGPIAGIIDDLIEELEKIEKELEESGNIRGWKIPGRRAMGHRLEVLISFNIFYVSRIIGWKSSTLT